MRYGTIAFSLLLLLFSQDLFASAKIDSIVTFLGGSHGKFVWKRWAWCNEDGSSKTQAQANADKVSLMLMDTRAGVERPLLTGVSNNLLPNSIRISRTGKWVTYIIDKATYILDITAVSPAPKVFIDSTKRYWAVRALWMDPATGDEYAFCLDTARYSSELNNERRSDMHGRGLFKVKINSDGTAGTATQLRIRELLTGINVTWKVDESISVSADGKKLGGAFPWPNTKIYDIDENRFYNRSNDMFGCQANIAPDNSYRFYHFEGEHRYLHMWEANMSTQVTKFDLNANLVGLPQGRTVDLFAPRWSNHVRYYTATVPMQANPYCEDPNSRSQKCSMDGGNLWNKSADWVRDNVDMLRISKFVMGRFAADFKSQEASIFIAADKRYLQYGGDAWICGGVTGGDVCGPVALLNDANRIGSASTARILRTGSLVTIHTGSVAPSVIRISDARGRVVRTWSGSGICTFDAQELALGTYLVTVVSGVRTETMRLPLTTR